LWLLSELLNGIFIPLENKNPEIRKTLQKFVSQINHTSQQVSGIVTIELPEVVDQIDDETAIHDNDLMAKYIAAMESWTQTIKDTIKRESEKQLETRTALAEIELWRSRSASLSTLNQQLSHHSINTIKERIERYSATENGSYGAMALEEFTKNSKNLAKQNAEAKENVKFLTTL
jgi:dynein heavy chain